MLCACGCGNEIIPKWFHKYYHSKFITGHNLGYQKGSNNNYWKGGRYIDRESGYVFIYKPDHPFCRKNRHVLEHRLVMEKYLGRYLDPNEIVHHINGNTSDNRIENLELFVNHSKHMKLHANKRWHGN